MEPDCKLNVPYKIDCPNMKHVKTESWDYALYKCNVCGKELKAFYEDMK